MTIDTAVNPPIGPLSRHDVPPTVSVDAKAETLS